MASGNTPRILIVEDDAMFRDTVREILRDLGYKVRGARSLSKAVKRLTRHHFDLVLSDVEIGDGTGFDVLQVARSARPGAQLVLMSASADPELTAQVQESGAARFLPKPFSMKELMKTVEDLLATMPDQAEESEEKPAKPDAASPAAEKKGKNTRKADKS